MERLLQTVNIKGKEYVEVATRVEEFRTNNKYEGWSLETEIVALNEVEVTMKAIIKDVTGRVIATGFANENRDSSMVNKTSYLENCETSAWGRALGNLGIGIKTSIASANEVSNAIQRQERIQYSQPQQTQYQEEIRNFNGADYVKKFSKKNNQYFWVICDENLVAQGYQKYLKVSDK